MKTLTTNQEFNDWLKQYFANRNRQRLGQAFVNKFFIDGMTDPQLFYCQTDDEAIQIIYGRCYIDLTNAWEV